MEYIQQTMRMTTFMQRIAVQQYKNKKMLDKVLALCYSVGRNLED